MGRRRAAPESAKDVMERAVGGAPAASMGEELQRVVHQEKCSREYDGIEVNGLTWHFFAAGAFQSRAAACWACSPNEFEGLITRSGKFEEFSTHIENARTLAAGDEPSPRKHTMTKSPIAAAVHLYWPMAQTKNDPLLLGSNQLSVVGAVEQVW